MKEAAAAGEAQSARLLAGLARRIASSLDLQETLQIVVQSVVDQLGFGAAVVNMARPGDICEVVAVAGSQDATEALLGTRAPMEAWYELLASCEAWGELRFLDHRSDQSVGRADPELDTADRRRSTTRMPGIRTTRCSLRCTRPTGRSSAC